MPLIGCRRKFVQNQIAKPENICSIQKAKVEPQKNIAIPPSIQKVQAYSALNYFQVDHKSRSQFVNWSGEDQQFLEQYNRESSRSFIYFPPEMIKTVFQEYNGQICQQLKQKMSECQETMGSYSHLQFI